MPHAYVTVDKRHGRIGITCSNGADGVLISALLEGSVGAAAGLNVGDFIAAVNGVLVQDHQQAIREIDAAADLVEFALRGSTERLRITRRTYLGITLGANSEGMGVEVLGLDRTGACAAAGLAVGQVILSVDGELCSSHEQAMTSLERGGAQISVVVEGGSRFINLDKHVGFVGITVADQPGSRRGVVVVAMQPGSLAIHAGLQLGDVVLSVNGERVDTHNEAIRLVDSARQEVSLVLAARRAELTDVLTAMSTSGSAPPASGSPARQGSRPASARAVVRRPSFSKVFSGRGAPLREVRPSADSGACQL